MKLVIYSHFFAPSIGGVETVVQSLASGLAGLRKGGDTPEFDVTLVTQTPAGSYDDSGLPFRVIRRPAIPQLWRCIRDSDVVHVAGPSIVPLILAKLAGKPRVIEHHGYQASCPNGLLFHHPTQETCPGYFQAVNYLECWNCNQQIEGSLGSWGLICKTLLRRSLSESATRNIAPSNHVAARQSLPCTTTIFHGVRDPSGPDTTVESCENTQARRFTYLGRLVVEKGVSVLVEAVRLLCVSTQGSVQLSIIGDGPDRPRLEKQIAASRLENNVRITGFLNGADLQREMKHAGTVVIPTIMEETAGLSALEQMVRGRPVIVSAVGGLQEIVGDAGLAVPPGNAQALANAMKSILTDPSIAKALGTNARNRVLRLYSCERMIEEHARLYREVHILSGD